MVIAWHIENELPRNKNRENKNGDGSPLTAWLSGAKAGISKIDQVCAGTVRFPYKSNIAALLDLSDRIAKRYEITWHQYDMLIEYLLCFYSGRSANRYSNLLGMKDSEVFITGHTSILFDIQRKLKKRIPLRAIIDPNVTNLILMHQFENAFKQKFSKAKTWT